MWPVQIARYAVQNMWPQYTVQNLWGREVRGAKFAGTRGTQYVIFPGNPLLGYHSQYVALFGELPPEPQQDGCPSILPGDSSCPELKPYHLSEWDPRQWQLLRGTSLY